MKRTYTSYDSSLWPVLAIFGCLLWYACCPPRSSHFEILQLQTAIEMSTWQSIFWENRSQETWSCAVKNYCQVFLALLCYCNVEYCCSVPVSTMLLHKDVMSLNTRTWLMFSLDQWDNVLWLSASRSVPSIWLEAISVVIISFWYIRPSITRRWFIELYVGRREMKHQLLASHRACKDGLKYNCIRLPVSINQ